MQVKASLNNLRMASRKVRLAADLIKGMDILSAKTQLRFMPKKAAGLILKLLNSAVANAKHNFSIEESNLHILKLVVDGGPSLKRWMPRAMGRATPILKRTCSISLVLEGKPGITKKAEVLGRELGAARIAKKQKAGKGRPAFAEVSAGEEEKIAALPELSSALPEKEETISAMPEAKIQKQKTSFVAKPYGAQEQGKKRFFSRQTFGNIKKVFRRKAI